jgi:uncharacterized membrane protein YcaP (DUF421 family)
MAGDYLLRDDAFILVGTLLAWNVFIDWLTFRIPRLQTILEPPPLLLIDRGRVQWANLRREFLSESELRSKLRDHEVADPQEVAKAYLEPDGQITVLKRKSAGSS